MHEAEGVIVLGLDHLVAGQQSGAVAGFGQRCTDAIPLALDDLLQRVVQLDGAERAFVSGRQNLDVMNQVVTEPILPDVVEQFEQNVGNASGAGDVVDDVHDDVPGTPVS